MLRYRRSSFLCLNFICSFFRFKYLHQVSFKYLSLILWLPNGQKLLCQLPNHTCFTWKVIIIQVPDCQCSSVMTWMKSTQTNSWASQTVISRTLQPQPAFDGCDHSASPKLCEQNWCCRFLCRFRQVTLLTLMFVVCHQGLRWASFSSHYFYTCNCIPFIYAHNAQLHTRHIRGSYCSW